MLRPLLDARDIGTGATLLFTACHNNLAFSINELLSAGADANIVTHAGASPLLAYSAHKPRPNQRQVWGAAVWPTLMTHLRDATSDAVSGAKGGALPPLRTQWPWDGQARVDGENAVLGSGALTPATPFLAAGFHFHLFTR